MTSRDRGRKECVLGYVPLWEDYNKIFSSIFDRISLNSCKHRRIIVHNIFSISGKGAGLLKKTSTRGGKTNGKEGGDQKLVKTDM